MTRKQQRGKIRISSVHHECKKKSSLPLANTISDTVHANGLIGTQCNYTLPVRRHRQVLEYVPFPRCFHLSHNALQQSNCINRDKRKSNKKSRRKRSSSSSRRRKKQKVIAVHNNNEKPTQWIIVLSTLADTKLLPSGSHATPTTGLV